MNRRKNAFPKSKKYKWSPEELLLINIVKRYPVLCSGRGKRTDFPLLWQKVESEMGVPAITCRQKWVAIKCRYKKYYSFGCTTKLRSTTKYADGTLNFLDYYISKGKQVHEDDEFGENSSTSSDDLAQMVSNVDDEEVEFIDASVSSPNEFSVVHPNTYDIISANQAQVSQKSSTSTSGTTVLTQDIIEYILKTKNEEVAKENDDIFQSMANFVQDDQGTNPVTEPFQSIDTSAILNSNTCQLINANKGLIAPVQLQFVASCDTYKTVDQVDQEINSNEANVGATIFNTVVGSVDEMDEAVEIEISDSE